MVGPRRRRRIGPVIGVVTVAVLITVFVFAIRLARPSAKSVQHSGATYLDLARPLAQESSQQAMTVAAVRSDPASTGLVELKRQLSSLVSQASWIAQAARQLVPPTWLESAQHLFVQAMAERSEAASELNSGMALAVSSAPLTQAISRLDEAGRSIAASNSSYRRFRQSIPRSLGGRRSMPFSEWPGEGGIWSGPTLTEFVEAVRGSQSLMVKHDTLLVLVSLDPLPLAAGSTIVEPPTTRLRVTLTVVNTGTVAENAVPVVATLQPSSGQRQLASSSVAMEAGQHLSISLAPFAVVSGATYVLTSSVGPVPGESDTQDNTLSMRISIS